MGSRFESVDFRAESLGLQNQAQSPAHSPWAPGQLPHVAARVSPPQPTWDTDGSDIGVQIQICEKRTQASASDGVETESHMPASDTGFRVLK